MITLFTAITGGKDNLISNQASADSYIAFVDRFFDSKTWEQYPITDKFANPVMNAKLYKILPHKFLNTDYSIWVDGNIKIKESAEKIVEELLGDADMAFFKHPGRDCIYEEAEACKNLSKGNVDEIDGQIETYRQLGIPGNMGLTENNVIIRRHNSKTKVFNEAWWAEICSGSERDQLSCPITMKEFENVLKINIIEPSVHYHPYFGFLGHVL